MRHAWNQLSRARRAELASLQRKGWTEGFRLERLPDEAESEGWVEYELLPPDPTAAEPERIGRWPVKVELDERGRVRAIREEHGI